MCDVCNYNINNITNITVRICRKCWSKKNVLISSPDTKQKFLLANNDLINVRVFFDPKKRYNFYLLKDIQNLAIAKHGSLKNVRLKITNKKKLNKDKSDLFFNEIKYRRNKLEKYLLEINYGIIPKPNKLCILEDYIMKGEKSTYDMDQIGKILLEMKFFSENTDYDAQFKLMKKTYKKYTVRREILIHEELKGKLLMQYVIDNKNNMHKIMESIPLSLVGLVDEYYKTI